MTGVNGTASSNGTSNAPNGHTNGLNGTNGNSPMVGVGVPLQHKKLYPPITQKNLIDGKRPNLIMFMPDQLRYDSLGHTGNPVVKTPHLDEFAKDGVRFTNCFTQASVCTQSRCSMFSGQYLHVNGHRSLEHTLHTWEGNMFKSLKDDGYHVAAIGARGDLFDTGVTELSMDEYGWIMPPTNEFSKRIEANKKAGIKPEIKNDIDSRLFYKGIRSAQDAFDYDAAVTASALEWLSAPKEPFGLFMPLIFPHPPFVVEEPYFSMYKTDELPMRVKTEVKTGYEPRYMKAIRDAYGTERATEDHWNKVKTTYYGMISRLDDQFGEINDALKKLDGGKLYERTYRMMFTDHGEYLGDSDLIEKWPAGVSDSLSHEPLIISGPGIPSGQVNESICEMVDLPATVFELLGVPETYPHCGESLVEVMKENKSEHKEYAFTEGGFLEREEPWLEVAPWPYDLKASLQHMDTTLVGRAIACRDKQWTYVYRLYEPAELYNRLTDPGEAHNLAAEPEHAALCLKFERVILKWMVSTSDFLPYKKDKRFPEVTLVPPKQQLEERRALLQAMVEH